MINIMNITKRYGTKDNPISVLENINMEVDDNEIIAIMGPSGCGKTTLLNIMAGLTCPTFGQMNIDGMDVDFNKDKLLLDLRRSKIGYIPQYYSLIDRKSVYDNITLSLKNNKERKKQTENINQIMDFLSLSGKINSFPTFLSHGEKQKVAIARTLINKKRLILADEPTSSLDKDNAVKIIQLFRKYAEDNQASIVLSTHDGNIANLCDRVIHLSYGEMKCGD